MSEWMNNELVKTNKWINERMTELINVWINEWLNEYMNAWMNGLIHWLLRIWYKQIIGYTN